VAFTVISAIVVASQMPIPIPTGVAMPQKAIIYARTSPGQTADDIRVPNIEKQLQVCQEYCRQKGYEILGEYQDDEYSGRTYPMGCKQAVDDNEFQAYAKARLADSTGHARPGLAELLSTLNDADVVVAIDWSRIARPLSQSLLIDWLKQQLKDARVEIDMVHDDN